MIKDRNVKENGRIRQIYCLGYDSMKIPAHLTFLSKDWFFDDVYIANYFIKRNVNRMCSI